jgi:hypothetical protein
MFLENSDQDIESDCNPDIGHYHIFSHAKKALIRKHCMAGLGKLHVPATVQNSGARQCLRKPFLITQNIVLIFFHTTKCAISQSKNRFVKIISYSCHLNTVEK